MSDPSDTHDDLARDTELVVFNHFKRDLDGSLTVAVATKQLIEQRGYTETQASTRKVTAIFGKLVKAGDLSVQPNSKPYVYLAAHNLKEKIVADKEDQTGKSGGSPKRPLRGGGVNGGGLLKDLLPQGSGQKPEAPPDTPPSPQRPSRRTSVTDANPSLPKPSPVQQELAENGTRYLIRLYYIAPDQCPETIRSFEGHTQIKPQLLLYDEQNQLVPEETLKAQVDVLESRVKTHAPFVPTGLPKALVTAINSGAGPERPLTDDEKKLVDEVNRLKGRPGSQERRVTHFPRDLAISTAEAFKCWSSDQHSSDNGGNGASRTKGSNSQLQQELRGLVPPVAPASSGPSGAPAVSSSVLPGPDEGKKYQDIMAERDRLQEECRRLERVVEGNNEQLARKDEELKAARAQPASPPVVAAADVVSPTQTPKEQQKWLRGVGRGRLFLAALILLALVAVAVVVGQSGVPLNGITQPSSDVADEIVTDAELEQARTELEQVMGNQ